ncbi:MAG: ribosome maturation factor RimM [Janthinobacterium lividum]
MTEIGSDIDEYSVLAAEVAGAHGVSGSLRLRLIGASASDATSDAALRSLQVGRVVRLVRSSDNFQTDLTLIGMRRQPKGFWIARFKGLTDRNGAEALNGCSVLIKETERASLPEGEYYVDQLLGLDVIADTGRSFGKLSDVLTSPAHDVYITDIGAMIPVAGDYIISIDLEAGKITVRDVPGLIDDPSVKNDED